MVHPSRRWRRAGEVWREPGSPRLGAKGLTRPGRLVSVIILMAGLAAGCGQSQPGGSGPDARPRPGADGRAQRDGPEELGPDGGSGKGAGCARKNQCQ